MISGDLSFEPHPGGWKPRVPERPESMRLVLISECAAANPGDNYGASEHALFPAGSTYRLRGGDFRLGDIRLFPSYLQAGPAWYIEASKREMIAEDISAALTVSGIRGA